MDTAIAKKTVAEAVQLDGRALYYSFLAGASRLIEHQKHINKINVFPVPDGDTGVNMASTVRHVIEKVKPHRSFKKTIHSIASAALDGARGNSGIIMAQFLEGLNRITKEEGFVDVGKFSLMARNAVRFAYDSIEKPVEGTIVTVIREWAEYMDSIKEKTGDFRTLIRKSLHAAHLSLLDTPNKLSVLKKHHVVDAGAQGFVYFLEGINEYLKDFRIKKFLRLRKPDRMLEIAMEPVSAENLTFRYCTEAVVEGEHLLRSKIRDKIWQMGDSLVIAGTETKCRIHIHTDQPALFFQTLKEFGSIPFQKADDMQRQHEAAYKRKWNIALVTDSSCDLPKDILDKYQVHLVPIHLHVGEDHYLDKITIEPEQFYDLLPKTSQYPSTSQPNAEEFKNLYRFLVSHYDSVIALHLPEKLSGTFQSSRQAAFDVGGETGKRIDVMDTRQLSGSLGLIVHRAAQAIEQGKAHDEILRHIPTWSKNTSILVSVKSLDSMIRGGRVSPMKGWLANVLNLKPIISIDKEGKSILFDKAFSQKGNIKKVLSVIRNRLQKQDLESYTILHAHDNTGARTYAKQMEELTGKPPDFFVNISPVVGLNAGRGALAAALMFKEEFEK